MQKYFEMNNNFYTFVGVISSATEEAYRNKGLFLQLSWIIQKTLSGSKISPIPSKRFEYRP